MILCRPLTKCKMLVSHVQGSDHTLRKMLLKEMLKAFQRAEDFHYIIPTRALHFVLYPRTALVHELIDA